MTSDHPMPRSTDVPIPTALTPLDVWTAIKTVLRRELGEREYEMWIQHVRLWRMMPDATMGVLVPRSGRACFGALRHIKRVRSLARRMGYAVMITVHTDMETFQLRKECYDALDSMGDDHRKRELLASWQAQKEWLAFPFLEPPCSPLWEDFKG